MNPDEALDLPAAHRAALDWWIDNLIIPYDRQRVIPKSIFECDTGYHIHLDAATFNAALRAHGYDPQPDSGQTASFVARLIRREGLTIRPLLGWHAQFAQLVEDACKDDRPHDRNAH